MKLSINKIKIIPQAIGADFGFCVFGEPTSEVKSWIQHHGFEIAPSGRYTNIKISPSVKMTDIFEIRNPFEYMDGFSPNLNKKLHIGHFSNLVLAQAFKKLGICKNTVSIFGDTLDGAVSKEEALKFINEFIAKNFDYKPDNTFYASTMKYTGSLLVDGTEKYAGTKVFNTGDEKVVGIKGDGSTTYFYQDVVLAETLNSSTLYLTGKEQNNHFRLLHMLFPSVEHIGLGLVKVGKKMSSREGNVIFMEDFIGDIGAQFEQIDLKLIYNIFAGFILKSTPESDKNIKIEDVSDPKKSAGLYISYTMARLKSAGVNYVIADTPTQVMEFAFLKAYDNLMPNILFDAIIDLCKEINGLYTQHTIKGNKENEIMFHEKLSQVLWGCEKLGLFLIDKV